MRVGGAYECVLPNGRVKRFTVVDEATKRRDAWVVEDDCLDVNGKRWMFGKNSWIELNSTEVPFL
jgi:hypothetical protein